jgi:hypothetical protein
MIHHDYFGETNIKFRPINIEQAEKYYVVIDNLAKKPSWFKSSFNFSVSPDNFFRLDKNH